MMTRKAARHEKKRIAMKRPWAVLGSEEVAAPATERMITVKHNTLSAGLRRSGALSMRLSEFDSVIVAPLDQNLNLEV